MNLSTLRSPRRSHGFSTIELLVVVAIGIVIAAVAVPSVWSGYRTYQLNSAASQVASVLRFTRFEAIRQNTPIDFRTQVLAGGNVQAWADSAAPVNDGNVEATEDQFTGSTSGNVVAVGGVPNTAAIATAIGVGALTAVPPAGGLITFDQRGAVTGASAVYAICLQNTATSSPGYRAVIVLPSGAIELWSSDSAGNWSRIG